jgi:hypothetical protein
LLRIKIGTSRYHTPPIQFELVYFGVDPLAKKDNKVVSIKELIIQATKDEEGTFLFV